ncbi:hypothetical protein [Streptomyces sp. SAJ15]|uniref:hypothetical protein n=1 Tax=Streptomyces sp. SAJ15 TaxID=2011095 RepID=UPI001185FBC7|nr:hypothetical protein [Streptomyces sp. SAJ15]TVL89825.1 hypothetical protein CD790_25875 [Streptomyces sp. SAJ15]
MTLLLGYETAVLTDADLLQLELVEADQQFHRVYGTDEAGWLPQQVAAYNAAMDAVWAAHAAPRDHRAAGP